jgi:hypothetical protein
MLPLLRLLVPLVAPGSRLQGADRMAMYSSTSCACVRLSRHCWQAVCAGLFDTLVSVAVLARSRIIFLPSQCAAVVDVHCATAGSRDRVAYSMRWIAINFN